jgi:hypothetical protein
VSDFEANAVLEGLGAKPKLRCSVCGSEELRRVYEITSNQVGMSGARQFPASNLPMTGGFGGDGTAWVHHHQGNGGAGGATSSVAFGSGSQTNISPITVACRSCGAKFSIGQQ